MREATQSGRVQGLQSAYTKMVSRDAEMQSRPVTDLPPQNVSAHDGPAQHRSARNLNELRQTVQRFSR